jgi:uncharacterized repeat protein (TIGR04076 family)
MNHYTIEIEIYEGKGGQLQKEGERVIYPDVVGEGICAWMYRGDGVRSYQVGEKFNYPEDAGKICPWLLDSLQGVLAALRYGGTLPWQYPGTAYEKKFDEDGITTEFVRCIDPTESGIVVKVIRKELGE